MILFTKNERRYLNMKKIVKMLVLSLAIIVFVSGVGGPAFAQNAHNMKSQSNGIGNKYVHSILDENAIEEIEKYIFVQNNKYHLKLNNESIKLFSPELRKEIRDQLKFMNKEIEKAGIKDLDVKNGNEIYVSDYEIRQAIIDAGIDVHDDSDISIMAAGVTKVQFHWWGVTVYLSATALKLIYGAVAGGMTITAAALLMVPAVGWAIAAGMAGGIATVATQTQKHGYVFRFDLRKSKYLRYTMWRQ